MSYGKIIDGKLVIARKKIKIENGSITDPTEEQLIANGYKVVEYTEKPIFDKEEEKLVEKYFITNLPPKVNDGQQRIFVEYEKVALTKEEKIEVIKQEIIEEENKITKRNILDFAVDKDNEALNRIQQHRSIIIELREKLREIIGE